MPETASENGDEWEESEKITSRAGREKKNTQTRRGRRREREQVVE